MEDQSMLHLHFDSGQEINVHLAVFGGYEVLRARTSGWM